MNWRRLLGAGLLIAATSTQAATASLSDATRLEALLKASPQCCVVDARGAKQQSAAPLEGALVWHTKLRIRATSVVVVVADTDAKALAVARRLVRTSAHDVIAVEGGLATWQRVLRRLEAAARRPDSPYTFIIPHNTCQQDEPLHIFEARPAKPAMSRPKTASP